jgi:hypothetical protein
MNTFIQQVFEILTTAPGSLIYHLILVFSIAAAIQVIITARGNRQVKSRLLTGLGFCWQSNSPFCLFRFGLARSVKLPFHPSPTDRILSALSLTWII